MSRCPKDFPMPETLVHLVGAGPGDAGLLTLRGAELLRRAEVVMYDGLVNPELLRLAPNTAELIFGGKHDRSRCVSQDELNALLLDRAGQGKRVVRLKGGDPYLFGRGGEEAEILAAHGIAFEVVPGVSSTYSVPAYAGIPLTHRDYCSSFTVITGHEDPSSLQNRQDWSYLGKCQGTLVVLMGLKNLRLIAEQLIAHGKSASTPAAVISHGTLGEQRTITGTLATIADLVELENLPAPAVIVIGEVVKLREKLNWFEQRPLFGKRVAVTQRSDLAQPLVQALREKGAEVLEIPASRWIPHPNTAMVDQAIGRINSYDWILFSNQLGVDFFLQRLLALCGDLRALGHARLGAYGPLTGAKLRQWHLQPAAVAADHKTPLIMEAITRCGSVNGQRFLVLRGDEASERVPEALEAMGARVDVVPCFAVVPETDEPAGAIEKFREHGADWLIFASGLAIEHIHHRFNLPQIMAQYPGTRVAIASPTICWALDKLGLQPTVIAFPNDVPSLVNGIIRAEAGKNDRDVSSEKAAQSELRSWNFALSSP